MNNPQDHLTSAPLTAESRATRKVSLADVLWDAANVHLTTTYSILLRAKTPFTCNAISLAASGGCDYHSHGFVRDFLLDLGCTGSADQMQAISGLDGRRLQGARYMWLLLAMHVAADEDIWIEVSA